MSNPTPPKHASRLFGQYIIKSRFQFKFSMIVFCCLSAVAFFVWMEGNLVVKNMIENGSVTGEDAIAQLNLLNAIIGRTCILGLAITFGLSLFFSHFVAGPIYRFERILDDMKGGKLNMHVKLRKHDEFKDVADSFNQALSSLRVKIREDRGAVSSQADKLLELALAMRQKGAIDEAAQLEVLASDLKLLPSKIQI